jgi:hypothetical protein
MVEAAGAVSVVDGAGGLVTVVCDDGSGTVVDVVESLQAATNTETVTRTTHR